MTHPSTQQNPDSPLQPAFPLRNATPRLPSQSELHDLHSYLLRSNTAEASDDAWQLLADVWIAVFDHYISDGPGYAGRLIAVVYPAGPEVHELLAYTDKAGGNREGILYRVTSDFSFEAAIARQLEQANRALRQIVEARDALAEGGPTPFDPNFRCFDDWAADLAEEALGSKDLLRGPPPVIGQRYGDEDHGINAKPSDSSLTHVPVPTLSEVMRHFEYFAVPDHEVPAGLHSFGEGKFDVPGNPGGARFGTFYLDSKTGRIYHAHPETGWSTCNLVETDTRRAVAVKLLADWRRLSVAGGAKDEIQEKLNEILSLMGVDE